MQRLDAPSTGRSIGARLELGISVYGAAVFAVLWLGLAVGLVTDGRLLADAWSWLQGLEGVALILAWVLCLPIAVGLWAWTSGVPAGVAWAVVAGLLVWTWVAVGGLRKAIARR